jgi:hypothetical protein
MGRNDPNTAPIGIGAFFVAPSLACCMRFPSLTHSRGYYLADDGRRKDSKEPVEGLF